KEQIIELCEEAKAYHFATVCIQPTWVSLANTMLKDSDVGITTVIGFPLGATSTFTKVAETRDAIASGATEVDMVINIGALKSQDDMGVFKDIKAVVEAADGAAVVKVNIEVLLEDENSEEIIKVIRETCYLTVEEKILACNLAKEAGADFVKTSTGFGPGAATVADIELMREAVGPDMGVKASGGVRDQKT